MKDIAADREREPPVACDFTAMDAAQRERHGELRELLAEDLREVRELPDGYAFKHSSEPSVVMMVAKYVTLERLCCPSSTSGSKWGAAVGLPGSG